MSSSRFPAAGPAATAFVFTAALGLFAATGTPALAAESGSGAGRYGWVFAAYGGFFLLVAVFAVYLAVRVRRVEHELAESGERAAGNGAGEGV